MPLVVLRSWNDGSPPVVRRIAKDSDHKESQLIVIPDHNGTFITQEVPAGKDVPDELANIARVQKRSKFNHPNSYQQHQQRQRQESSPQSPEHVKGVNGVNGHNGFKYNGNSNSPLSPLQRSFSTMSPIPFRTNHNHQHHDVNLIRSRSSLSIDSGGSPASPTTSIPSSPNPNSRYKSLGPEFEATVPKRMIINRSSWIRHDMNNRLSRVSDDDDW